MLCGCAYESSSLRKALLRGVDETHAREDVPAERTLHERHVLAQHERRKAVKRRVDAKREVATPFLFLLFGFYVQMRVGGACGGYIRIV